MMLTSNCRSRLGRRSAPLWALFGVMGAFAVAPGAASAATNFTCNAQALRASGLLSLSTAAANGGGDPCTTQHSGVNVSLAPLITAGVANANTTSTATGGSAEADVALTGGLITSSVLQSKANIACSKGNTAFSSTSQAANVTVGGVTFNASGSANVILVGLPGVLPGLPVPAAVTVSLNPSPVITSTGITQDAAIINIFALGIINENIVLAEASVGADSNPCATGGGGGGTPPGGGGTPPGGGGTPPGTGGNPGGGGVTSPPQNVSPPVISGNPQPGNRLSCSTGTFTGSPTSYTYQWKLAGRVIPGANGSTYVVTIGDEASGPSDALTCVVTASNGAGASAPATSRGVLVAVPGTLHCARPTGQLSGSTLGVLGVGLSQKTARLRLPRYNVTHNRFDNFCLYAGWGIRVGYPSAALIRADHAGAWRGRIVIALTANPFYSLDRTRPGARLTRSLQGRLHLTKPFHIGLNYWYFVPGSGSRGVLKVRGGVIQEVGIASRQLSNGRSAQGRLLHSFPNAL